MEMLNDIEVILGARSAQEVWQHYVARLTELGFPNISYHAVRILEASCDRMLEDRVLLSSYPPRLMQELAALDLLESLPMHRWLTHNRGSESWDWMRRLRLAGRLTPQEERAADAFARYGHVAGYAVGMGDDVERVRAGVILGGAIGMRQDRLDALWAQHGRLVEALSRLAHLRISTLPHAEQECVLTLRQREVLECISVGRTTQEIAEILDVTPATVEKHLRLARKALGAKTTAQAILLAASRRQIFNSTAEPHGPGQGGHPSPARDGAPGLSARDQICAG
ncbi:histidine kinase (plasmid) [Paracoccus versutus]|uniref:LuxR family transcriptional regulator n=2 Tax=Paracoccus versutus TaxID=34007 RepID=A0A3D9XND6_PARVE|nr:LuxR family transcriptional regulator [Paracoccus sp. FO-3]REF71914.1 LuxR family transcriptional regulator [Paracoccus versutus]WGR56087.1 histidine kinase [Paracoccus versutus]